MNRRSFLKSSAVAWSTVCLTRCGARDARWREVRLVGGESATPIERAVLADAGDLLSRAVAGPVPVVTESSSWGRADVLVATPQTSETLRTMDRPPSRPGSFRVERGRARLSSPLLSVAGSDAEGARNGLYHLLETFGFAFFRDGETIPRLSGNIDVSRVTAGERVPAFRFRGDMIWDNYLGPRRYCAAAWGEAEWERALLFAARSGLNFIEFYPPLERVFALAFPEARGLSEGRVWKADFKHRLAQKVLARGRALGIRFLYVLSYGAFPEPVRDLYPRLEWRNGFLCAQQPELRAISERVWRILLEEMSTDHLYAIRHRGEEGQSYSDPCRSVTKAEGYRQAIEVMRRVDPGAFITVWTWGESPRDLFAELPLEIRAAHVRHGMADVFGDRGAGREQTDGAPELPPGRRWLAVQFTVFGGNEVSVRTAWCDPATLARDATVAGRDDLCEGYFQWPEWSDTSPWLSHVIAKLAWEPEAFDRVEERLGQYARARHGDRARPFLAAFGPLIRAGNACFMSTPRKRLLVPYFLGKEPLAVLAEVRDGARLMVEHAWSGAPSTLYHRDLLDVLSWIGTREAQVLEADGYLRHVHGDHAAARRSLSRAAAVWGALRNLLAQIPALSIVDSARVARRTGPLSEGVVESFWRLACDFYHGYPLVLGPEAVELVYLPQSIRLAEHVEAARDRGELAVLESPGWFWHDFPDPAWAELVRRLPHEDEERFERVMKHRLHRAVRADERGRGQGASSALLDRRTSEDAIAAILGAELPAPLQEPPVGVPPAGGA